MTPGNYVRTKTKCPYCGLETTNAGLTNHIKFKHPEKYEGKNVVAAKKATKKHVGVKTPETKETKTKETIKEIAENESIEKPTDSIESNDESILLTGAVERVASPTKQPTDLQEVHSPQVEPLDNSRIGQIQIIDSNTDKPIQSGFEKLMDVAFSEKYAPITTGLIEMIALKLTGGPNNDKAKGLIQTGVGGQALNIDDNEF